MLSSMAKNSYVLSLAKNTRNTFLTNVRCISKSKENNNSDYLTKVSSTSVKSDNSDKLHLKHKKTSR